MQKSMASWLVIQQSNGYQCSGPSEVGASRFVQQQYQFAIASLRPEIAEGLLGTGQLRAWYFWRTGPTQLMQAAHSHLVTELGSDHAQPRLLRKRLRLDQTVQLVVNVSMHWLAEAPSASLRRHIGPGWAGPESLHQVQEVGAQRLVVPWAWQR